MFGISWVYWLIGTVGISGAVALWLLAPAVATVVFNAIVRFLGWMVSTRIGCAILAFIAGFVIADIHRSRIDEASWKQQIAQFEQQQAARDKSIAEDARQQVLKEVADEQAANKKADQDKTDFDKNLDPKKLCLIGPDADRLRARAGLAKGKRHK